MRRYDAQRARRRDRYAARTHAQREAERRAAHGEGEPVAAHQPEHLTGCLRCFIARGQEREGGQEATR